MGRLLRYTGDIGRGGRKAVACVAEIGIRLGNSV